MNKGNVNGSVKYRENQQRKHSKTSSYKYSASERKANGRKVETAEFKGYRGKNASYINKRYVTEASHKQDRSPLNTNAYNPSKRYEEEQQIKNNNTNRFNANSSVTTRVQVKTNYTPANMYNPSKKYEDEQMKKYAQNNKLSANVKVRPGINSSVPRIKSGKNISINPKFLYYVKNKAENELNGSNDIGLQSLGNGIKGSVSAARALRQYYKAADGVITVSAKAGKFTIRKGYSLVHNRLTNPYYKTTTLKQRINHRIDNSHVVKTYRLLNNVNTRKMGIDVLKGDGKYFIKGAGKTTIKLTGKGIKTGLKTGAKSGYHIIKTAVNTGLQAIENSDDIGLQSLNAGVRTAQGTKEAVKAGAKATKYTYRGVKTGVKAGVKTAKTGIKAVSFIRKNGVRQAGIRLGRMTVQGVKKLGFSLLNLGRLLLMQGGKIILIGAVLFAVVSTMLVNAPIMAVTTLFGGTSFNDKKIEWNIHDYLVKQVKAKRKEYVENVMDTYNKLKSSGDYEIITLYNNLTAQEVAVNASGIKSSIPSAEDFVEILEPVFSVLMVTRYDLTVSNEQKKETFDYLWLLLSEIYTQKLTTQYCSEPGADGNFYAKGDCLRPSDTMYHTEDSGMECCTVTYSCAGHIDFCDDLGSCDNIVKDGKEKKCGGHFFSHEESDIAGCDNKFEKFSCSGHKLCLGHRRCRIVMDFKGINRLLDEEWGNRISELESQDSLTDEEKKELETLIEQREYCLMYVEFLGLNDENYDTDYSTGGGGGTNADVDPGDYDIDPNGTTGEQVVATALRYVGNPYVYGGNSLTNGIDCSAFTRQIYAMFGVSIPRTSSQQRSCGIEVGSLSKARAGDLICYDGHVAIYMGDGRIVHASNSKPYPQGGIKVSPNAAYRPIITIRRLV